jgi:hypothetical protein
MIASMPAGSAPDRLGHVAGRVVDGVGGPQSADEVIVRARLRCRDDRRPALGSELHGERAHAPGRADHENGVARADLDGVDRIQSRRADEGERRGDLEGEAGRLAGEDEFVAAGEQLGVRPVMERGRRRNEPEDGVPDREVRPTFAQGIHDAGEVPPDDGRELVLHHREEVAVRLGTSKPFTLAARTRMRTEAAGTPGSGRSTREAGCAGLVRANAFI